MTVAGQHIYWRVRFERATSYPANVELPFALTTEDNDCRQPASDCFDECFAPVIAN